MSFVRVLAVAAAAVLLASSAQAQPMTTAAAEPGNAPLEEGLPTDGNAASGTVAATAPIETELEPSAGHQASDVPLPAAEVGEAPNELEKADALQPPEPTLFADIDLTNQRMTVRDSEGHHYGPWKISSARGGYRTPTGTYTVHYTARMHYSKQYHWSPMPYSVFFNRGVAVHGTNAIGSLGRPASHGCVRTHPRDAKTFYNLVEKHGKRLTRVTVHGTPPYTPAVAERPQRRYAQPTFSPFGFFSYDPPSYNPRKRRYKRRQQYGGGYYGAW